ncbi:MAG: transcriptional regulator [Myxococcales bacterium]|nr:transcriptional regulator [Myxococcales bacterium]
MFRNPVVEARLRLLDYEYADGLREIHVGLIMLMLALLQLPPLVERILRSPVLGLAWMLLGIFQLALALGGGRVIGAIRPRITYSRLGYVVADVPRSRRLGWAVAGRRFLGPRPHDGRAPVQADCGAVGGDRLCDRDRRCELESLERMSVLWPHGRRHVAVGDAHLAPFSPAARATGRSAVNRTLTKLSGLDRIIHEPARLMISAILYAAKEADFLYLQRQTGLTKGNLSSHLGKLEAAGYLEIEKTYRGKIPLTLCRMTRKGRSSFATYEVALKRALF